jgi:hypothetical protein
LHYKGACSEENREQHVNSISPGVEKLAEEVRSEDNNSLGDKFADWAGLIGVELGDASDEPRGRHPSELTQLQEAWREVMVRRRRVEARRSGQHRNPNSARLHLAIEWMDEP